ncbi:hypothetical protein B0T25DRAFT_607682 [Lasiosphaeria hispida]|uniref:Uncharacterized protein n=1 Tax=Lasiosphaeria hispida TaxID=260671 RepID=A0AAJ0HJ01_9PEZI|nr:hypothetical protein B0T25DRAFT_607682 [Lasiosphaeria hispida]
MPSKLGVNLLALSQGHPNHTLSQLLDTATKESFQGVELHHYDLFLLSQLPSTSNSSSNAANMNRSTDSSILALNLEQISPPPATYASSPSNPSSTSRHLRTDIIQLQSNALPSPELSLNTSLIASDLRSAAKLGLACHPPVRFVWNVSLRVRSSWEQRKCSCKVT